MLFVVTHRSKYFLKRLKFFRNKAEAINYMINTYCKLTGDDKKSVLEDVKWTGYRHFGDSYVIGTRIIHVNDKFKMQLIKIL